jgi:hypothetical protein
MHDQYFFSKQLCKTAEWSSHKNPDMFTNIYHIRFKLRWINIRGCSFLTFYKDVYKSQAFGYTLWFSLFSLKLNIFPFSASILTFPTQNHLILFYKFWFLTFSKQNHLILKYFTNFDTTHFFLLQVFVLYQYYSRKNGLYQNL